MKLNEYSKLYLKNNKIIFFSDFGINHEVENNEKYVKNSSTSCQFMLKGKICQLICKKNSL